MLSTDKNTPRGLISGFFGPKFLDDPEAIPQVAQSLGIGPGAMSPSGGTSAPSTAPSAPGAPNPSPAGPVAGVVPKSFSEWASDPVNTAKVPQQINNSPMPTMGTSPMAPLSTPGFSGAPGSAMPSPFPNRSDWLAANPSAVQLPQAPKPLAGTGKSFLGMSLATALDSVGAALTHGQQIVGPEWMQNIQAGREYDRNLPAMRNQVETQAYQTALQQEQERAGIQKTGAETQNLLLTSPFYQKAGELRDSLTKLWQSGAMDEQNFDKAVALQLQGNPYARLITPDVLKQIKGLPQQPPTFKIGQGGTVEPITYRGKVYGVTAGENEPPEIANARQQALDSQQTIEYAKVNPIITGQIGAYPVKGTPQEKAAWAQKAEQITIHMAAAPKVIVQNAANPFQSGGQIVQGKTGDAALTNLSPSEQATIKFYGDGKGDVQTFMQRLTGAARADFIGKILAYNPDFDQATFGVRKGVETSFTSGAYSQQLTAFNTAINHMATFNKMAAALDNGNLKLFNSLAQGWATETGNPAPTNFEIAKDAFSGEVGKAFAGANVAEGDRNKLQEAISRANSPAALKGAAQTAQDLLEGKRKALKDTYESGKKGKAAFPEETPPRGAAGTPASDPDDPFGIRKKKP